MESVETTEKMTVNYIPKNMSNSIEKKKKKKKKTKILGAGVIKTNELETKPNFTYKKPINLEKPKYLKDPKYKGCQLWRWFSKLNIEEKQSILTIEDNTRVELVKLMSLKHTKKQRGYFWGIDKSQLTYYDQHKYLKLENFDGVFIDDDFSKADLEFENIIRISPHDNSPDIITIERSYLENGENFLNLMYLVTRCKFLSRNCQVEYDKNDKTWTCGKPKWFENRDYYTLSTYVSSLFEQSLWVAFQRYNDPEFKKISKKLILQNSLKNKKVYLLLQIFGQNYLWMKEY